MVQVLAQARSHPISKNVPLYEQMFALATLGGARGAVPHLGAAESFSINHISVNSFSSFQCSVLQNIQRFVPHFHHFWAKIVDLQLVDLLFFNVNNAWNTKRRPCQKWFKANADHDTF